MVNNGKYSTLNIKVLSLPIEIVTNNNSFLKEFCNLTSALASPDNGESPAVRFRVVYKRRYVYIEKDSRVLYRVDKDHPLCLILIDSIGRSCYEKVGESLLFHAGAVAKNGRAGLLPGKSGSGKTTLTLGLMNYGYKYLTDEVAAIDYETLKVVPFQRPLSVWTWWTLPLPLRQEVRKDFRIYRNTGSRDNGWRWQNFVPQGEAVMPKDARWKVDWIIFPTYTPGGGNVLKPLRAAEAIMALMTTSWNPHLFPDGGLKRCKELVRRASCYRLEMGSLDRACELIEDLHVKAH